MFWLKLHISVNISVSSRWNYHKPLQTMTRTTTNDDMNHHKSQITTNHHKPWHKPPWTMTETSTKHDMNHYKSPQTMTWTIMMTQKELCIKPYGFLVKDMTLVEHMQSSSPQISLIGCPITPPWFLGSGHSVNSVLAFMFFLFWFWILID